VKISKPFSIRSYSIGSCIKVTGTVTRSTGTFISAPTITPTKIDKVACPKSSKFTVKVTKKACLVIGGSPYLEVTYMRSTYKLFFISRYDCDDFVVNGNYDVTGYVNQKSKYIHATSLSMQMGTPIPSLEDGVYQGYVIYNFSSGEGIAGAVLIFCTDGIERLVLFTDRTYWNLKPGEKIEIETEKKSCCFHDRDFKKWITAKKIKKIDDDLSADFIMNVESKSLTYYTLSGTINDIDAIVYATKTSGDIYKMKPGKCYRITGDVVASKTGNLDTNYFEIYSAEEVKCEETLFMGVGSNFLHTPYPV
ncbi:MAG: hypothetical protein KAH30_04180, partial [Caldisericia bacterium]|nr:hypothetical protein [Caldisericia bacterium]